MARTIINEDNILKILDEMYLKACNGIPRINASVEDMADDYIVKHKDVTAVLTRRARHIFLPS